ncbi:MAG: hypothetical protein ACOX8S_05395 [Christensenellales bacterium]|jgi:hypothetical protein
MNLPKMKSQPVRKRGFEPHQWQIIRLTFESFGFELGVSMQETEVLYIEAACPGQAMPGAAQMLEIKMSRE